MRALSIVPESFARDVQREDALVAGELFVGGEEVSRGRLGSRRRLLGRLQPLVERVRRELDVVAEALVAEADVERDDPPVGEPLRCLGEIGRRVDDDRGVLGGQLRH